MEALPHDMVPEPVPVDDDKPGFVDFEDLAAPAEPAKGPTSLDAVFDVPVKVQAVLGRARMSVGALLGLTAGTIVELDRRIGEPIDIFVNDRLVARGEVVLIDGALGVTLTEIVRPDR